tara:strand:- start:142 stop:450 length:309 start_codon:yes stop_codon:yes gene_type:complete
MSEYYQFYLTLHQHPKCRLLHFIGQWTTLAFTAFVCYSALWYLVPLIPFIIYPFAWAGHLYFEKNRPLAWEGTRDFGWTTLRAKVCDWIMFKDILLGRLGIW